MPGLQIPEKIILDCLKNAKGDYSLLAGTVEYPDREGEGQIF